MSANTHDHLLAESGALKMRAGPLLMSSDEEERFEGVVMLHDVVRIEEEALRLLPSPSAETRLRFAIENCGALIDARDPVGAAAAWDRIIAISMELDAVTARSMRSRIDPKYDRFQVELSRFVAKKPGALDIISGIHRGETLRNARIGVVARSLAKAMPGVARFWLCVAEHSSDDELVTKAVNRARRLSGMGTDSLVRSQRPLTMDEEVIVRQVLAVWLSRHGVYEIAEKLAVKPHVISKVRSGERRPTKELLSRIARAYGITLEKLLEMALVPQEPPVAESPPQHKRYSAA